MMKLIAALLLCVGAIYAELLAMAWAVHIDAWWSLVSYLFCGALGIPTMLGAVLLIRKILVCLRLRGLL